MTTELQTYELANYDRILRFRGELIAHATNRKGSDSEQIRWSEMDIYRTQAGTYVLHKIGKSRVYHGGDKMCSGSGGRTILTSVIFRNWSEEAVDDLAPCPVCQPADLDELKQVRVEVDRGVAHTATAAAGVVESAYSTDGDKVVYLTKVAERALAEAAAADPAIRDAYMVEEIA